MVRGETGTKRPRTVSSDQATAVIVGGTAHFLSDQGYREFGVTSSVIRMMGDKLWVSDESGDRLTDGLITIPLPTIPQREHSTDLLIYYDVHDKTIFATDGQIWQSDGTADGTFPIWNGTEQFSGAVPIPNSDTFLFRVHEGEATYAHYAYDGKESHFVSRELPGFEVEWRTTGEFALLDDGRGIWATDGTAENSFKLFEENADFIDAMKTDAFGEFVFFTEFSLSQKKDRRIWVTDGTRSGTRDLGSFGNSSIIYGEDLYTAGEEGLVRRPLSRWHNYSSPYDTTRDRQLTPRDALVVINELINRNHSNRVSGKIESPKTSFFYDVSQDRLLTPIDALRVINELLRNNRVSMGASALRTRKVASKPHGMAGAVNEARVEEDIPDPSRPDNSSRLPYQQHSEPVDPPIQSTTQFYFHDFAASHECGQKDDCTDADNARSTDLAFDSDFLFDAQQFED